MRDKLRNRERAYEANIVHFQNVDCRLLAVRTDSSEPLSHRDGQSWVANDEKKGKLTFGAPRVTCPMSRMGLLAATFFVCVIAPDGISCQEKLSCPSA